MLPHTSNLPGEYLTPQQARGLLGLLLLLFLGLGFLFSVYLPLGEASDERDHFILVRFIAEQGHVPLSQAERDSLGDKGDASPFYHALVAHLTQPQDISALPSLPVQYKPWRHLYFDSYNPASFYHTADERWPWRGIVLAWHRARFLSVLLGLATVLGTYAIARTVFPRRPTLALAATALVAFQPRLLTNVGLVNDDNLMVPLVTLCLYLLVRLVQGDWRWTRLLALGLLLGLAVLTKYHAVVLLPQVLLWLLLARWQHGYTWAQVWRSVGWLGLGVTLACGWWFVFLFATFNQIAELGLVAGLLMPLGDPVTASAASANVLADPAAWVSWIVPLFQSFWLVYGVMTVFGPTWIYAMLAVISGLAALGLGLAILAWARQADPWPVFRLDLAVLALQCLVYVGIVFVRYQTFPHITTAQGRHVFPALAGFAILLIFGLDSLLRWFRAQPFRPALPLTLIPALISLSVFALFGVIRPAYPYLPISTRSPDSVSMMRLDEPITDAITLLGFNRTPSEIRAGEALPLTLYWRSEARPRDNFLLDLCLVTAAGDPVTCRQAYPLDGAYPTRAWDAGYLIPDALVLPTPTCLPAGRYDLRLSLWPLRDDQAMTRIAGPEPAHTRTLTTLAVRASDAPPEALVCHSGSCDSEAEARMHLVQQSRQSLTLLGPGQPAEVRTADKAGWASVLPPRAYTCPDGTPISSRSFVAHAALSSGQYQLAFDDGRSLAVQVDLPERSFAPPPAALSTSPTTLNVRVDDHLILHNYRTDLEAILPGQTITVDTLWQARRTTEQYYVSSVQLLDHNLINWAQDDRQLGFRYPAVLWAPGEYVRQLHQLQVGRHVAAGVYQLKLTVYNFTNDRIEPVALTALDEPQALDELPLLGQVRVLDPANEAGPSTEQLATVGKTIKLRGYDLDTNDLEPGGTLDLALHWSSRYRPPSDYTVFTQLIGPDGRVYGQQDNPPQGGSYPTSEWAVQDRVVDHYRIPLAEDAPPGEYRLVVGMYRPETGERLPARQEDGRRWTDDAILISILPLDF